MVTSQLQIKQCKQTKENYYKALMGSIKLFDMDALPRRQHSTWFWNKIEREERKAERK